MKAHLANLFIFFLVTDGAKAQRKKKTTQKLA